MSIDVDIRLRTYVNTFPRVYVLELLSLWIPRERHTVTGYDSKICIIE